jgi:hypothetical protein
MLRRRGFGIAYRMLGSVSEAEDVAQEALLRLTRQEAPIDEPAAWMTTVSTGAEDPEDLALLDGERHVLDGHVLPVALVQVVDLDDAHGWSGLPAPRPHIAQLVRPGHPPDG